MSELTVAHPLETPLGAARRGLDLCVHCGFCMQGCPTYLALEDENDSPRGRIVLMRALVEGTLTNDDESVRTHIDRCLGCRACETACPSGVPYGELLEATRATLARDRPLPVVARLVLWVFATRARLAVAMGGARLLRASGIAALLARLPGRAGFAMAMLASTRRSGRAITGNTSHRSTDNQARAAGTAGRRGRAAILRGCVMEGLFYETNRATERAVRDAGYEIVDAPDQMCCGALHAHAGDLAGARELARANTAAFDESGASVIVTNAAGCGAMLESYGHLLADDPAWAERAARVAGAAQDISEVVASALAKDATTLVAPTSRSRTRVAYDPPCHLYHAQRVTTPPLAMLGAVPDIELVPLADADQCCGAAGIYNLLEPSISEAVLAAKLAQISASGASYVATGNPGCLMQIGAGLRRAGSHVRAVHPVDVWDESLGKN
jgi:glycolate oxidase iron-sulfur subunit